MIGKTLSHYRVTAALGAGGMGEVYRATDTTLNRDVAIKVLPAAVAQDEERLARFRREAQLLASLNHTNIAAIYGLEEAEGKPFLALELVEGEDLKERLGRGAIPVDEALGIALQITEALEEAHEKGIVHRDLKPANVKLTPDGKMKVLDFGLAKAYAVDAASGSTPDLSQSPTLAHTGTAAGLILGTAAYMSPEQARGKPVDKRADIWAFGALLWEMVTGRQLFTGETVSDVLAAVLTRDPDWTLLPEEARDLRSLDLWTYSLDQGTLSRLTSGPRTEFHPVWSRDGRSVLFVVDRPPFEIHRIGVGGSAEGEPLWETELDTIPTGLSPDGRHVVYTLTEPGTGKNVWVAPLDGSAPPRTLRASTYEEDFGTFSPDGRWIAYQSDETGRPEIYVEAFPGPGERHQISAGGGAEPVWAHGSSEIFYRRGDEMRVVPTRTGSRFEFEPSRALFTLPFDSMGNSARNYDVTPDGRRIVAVRVPDLDAPRRIDIVTHWLDELSHQVPN